MDQPTRLNLAFIGFAAPVKRGITNPASPRTARAKAKPQDGLFGIVLVANALIGMGTTCTPSGRWTGWPWSAVSTDARAYHTAMNTPVST
jgi:hypothetical protein